MFHYTYQILYQNGMKYIGVRSSKKEPTQDTKYVGSSKYTPNDQIVRKDILAIWDTRQEALTHEIQLHQQFNVAESSEFYNRAKQTSHKFDTCGLVFIRTDAHKLKIKEALTGRTRSPEECLAISLGKKGKTHKPHSEETKNKMRESAKGRCNKQKGTPYSTEDRLRLYDKRCKYSHPVLWVNDITGERITATCQEMCIKFGKNTSDTKRFTKSIKSLGKLGVWGWRYNNGDSLTTYPE